jgi:hypothetical protein
MAIEYKKVLGNYVDKIVFVGFLVFFLVTAFKVVMRGPTGGAELSAISRTVPLPPPVVNKEEYVLKNFADPPEPDATLDFTSDPEKIEPGPGEKQCPRCGWIVPRSAARCPRPNCGYSWGGVTPTEPTEKGNGPELPIGPPFRVVEITRKPVDILFFGWLRNPFTKRIDLQINWGTNTRTKMVPLGESFHGYKLWPLEARDVKVEQPTPHTTKAFFLTIQKKDSQPIIAEKGKIVRENEAMALLDVRGGAWRATHRGDVVSPPGDTPIETYVQYKLEEIGGERRVYTVTEVKEKEIVLQAKDGKQEALKVTPRRPLAAPAARQ